MRPSGVSIADDAVALVRVYREVATALDDLRASPDNILDTARTLLRNNVFVKDDAADRAIHDLVWLMDASASRRELQHHCYSLLAKVQVFAMYNSHVNVSRFRHY